MRRGMEAMNRKVLERGKEGKARLYTAHVAAAYSEHHRTEGGMKTIRGWIAVCHSKEHGWRILTSIIYKRRRDVQEAASIYKLQGHYHDLRFLHVSIGPIGSGIKP
jgi:hypothetical protein